MPRELIYKDEAYSAVLHDNPASAYCINRIKPVDAVEVIRCKDCKYYKQNPWSKEEHMICMGWCDWIFPDPDDFCSNGERREGE